MNSFAFVFSPLDFDGDPRGEVIPNHFFQRADPEKVEFIKDHLARFLPPGHSTHGSPSFDDRFRAYETAVEKSVVVALPREKWRYWIIEFDSEQNQIQNLQLAASLLQNDLEIGLTKLVNPSRGEVRISWNPGNLSSHISYLWGRRPVLKLTSHDLAEIGQNYRLIMTTGTKFNHIIRALERFDSLRSLPRHDDMFVIGLFSVIESIVTHAPKLTESGDSLAHQIKTKIPLLRKRFQRPLEYGEYFEPCDEPKIWSKLYEYRSRIVHGGTIEIEGDLRVLVHRLHIVPFLRETAKLVLLAALKEPELVNDLKQC